MTKQSKNSSDDNDMLLVPQGDALEKRRNKWQNLFPQILGKITKRLAQ